VVSVVSARVQQVKGEARAGGERTCRRCRSDGRARLRAAWAMARPREGRLERAVPTFGKARKSPIGNQPVVTVGNGH
jgi:hypothetical protein